MPEFTLSPNAYGRVAGGQEGSGQAQIFQPYDATKYDAALVAANERKAEQKAKGLKDARAFKPEAFEDLTTPWQADATLLSMEMRDIENRKVLNELAYYNNMANISDPDKLYEANLKVAQERAVLNSDIRDLENEVQLGLQNKEVFEVAENKYATTENPDQYDSEVTARRMKEFYTLEGHEDLIKKYGIQGARQYLLKNEWGGKLLEPTFNFAEYRDDVTTTNAKFGEEKKNAGVRVDEERGLLIRGESSSTTYNLTEIVKAEVNSLDTKETYRNWAKGKFSKELLAAYPDAKSVKDISEAQLLKWAETAPEFQTFVQESFLPKDKYSYVESGSQLRQDGAGSKVLTVDEIQSESEASNIFGLTEGEAGWNEFLTKNPILAEWTKMQQTSGSSKMKESVFGAYQLTNGDVMNATDATGKAGKNTQYEDPMTGQRRNIEGSYIITAPGFAGIKYMLLKDTVIDGKTYKKGDYINSEVIGDLKPNLDYRPISTTTTQGYGNTNVQKADGTVVRENVPIIIKNDAVEDFNLKPKAKQDAYQNEKTAVLVANQNVQVIDPTTGNIYNAADVIKTYEASLGGAESYEQWRKAIEEYESDLATGKLKIK
jgi:hypothetical protein